MLQKGIKLNFWILVLKWKNLVFFYYNIDAIKLIDEGAFELMPENQLLYIISFGLNYIQ